MQMSRGTERSVSDWVRYIQMLHYRTMDLTLDRIRTVIDRVTEGHVPFKVISIAGTNGKGSVATMVESILRQAGCITGLYTSPHIVDFNERFSVNGINISNEKLLEQFERVEEFRDNVPLTFFEYGTAIAIDYFIKQGVEVAILEVGLGGRGDAVNVLDADIACITSIGIDHVKWLGNTREKIGYEKAGILRSNQLAVCTDTDLPNSIRQVAQKLSTKLHSSGDGVKTKWGKRNWTLTLNSGKNNTSINRIPMPAIPGECQRVNAVGAVAVSLLMRKYFDISDNSIRTGIAYSQLDGRLQIVQANPEILLDVAHNIESVRELIKYLMTNKIKGKQIALMSVLSEKPIEHMVAEINPLVDEWHLCGIHDERGVSARQLFRRVQPVISKDKPIELHYDANSAIDTIMLKAQPEDRVVVFGSFLTVGGVLHQLSTLRQQ